MADFDFTSNSPKHNPSVTDYDYTDPITAAIQAKDVQESADSGSWSKLDRMEYAKNKKAGALAGKMGIPEGVGEMDSFQDLGGYNESLHNKIENYDSLAQLKVLRTKLNEEFGLVSDGQGNFFKRQEDGSLAYVDPEQNKGEYVSFYRFLTPDGRFEKSGISASFDPRDRYRPEALERFSSSLGEAGLDPEKSELIEHMVLPAHIANWYEAYEHGNKHMLDRRAYRMPTDPNDVEGRQQALAVRGSLGSGASEYYNTIDETPEHGGFFYEDKYYNKKKNAFGLGRDGELSYEERMELARQQDLRDEAQEGWSLARITNLPKIFAAGVAKALIVDPVAAGIELFGGDAGTAQSRANAVNKLFGANPYYAEKTQEVVSEYMDKIISDYKDENRKVDVADIFGILWAGVQQPEMLVDSLAYVGSMVFGLGKFTAAGKAIQATKAAQKAGNITKAEASAKIASIKDTQSRMAKVAHAVSNPGTSTAAVYSGYLNNNLEEFVENGGIITAESFARVAGVSAAALALDRYADVTILTGAVKRGRKAAVEEVIKDMGKEEYKKTARNYLLNKAAMSAVAKASGRVAGSALFESGVEYVQEWGEIFATEYATAKYGEDFKEFFTSEERHADALVASALGFAIGGQMEVGGLAFGRATRSSLAEKVAEVKRKAEQNRREQESITKTTEEKAAERVSNTDEFIKAAGKIQEIMARPEFTPDDYAELSHYADTIYRTEDNILDSEDAVTLLNNTKAQIVQAKEKFATLVIQYGGDIDFKPHQPTETAVEEEVKADTAEEAEAIEYEPIDVDSMPTEEAKGIARFINEGIERLNKRVSTSQPSGRTQEEEKEPVKWEGSHPTEESLAASREGSTAIKWNTMIATDRAESLTKHGLFAEEEAQALSNKDWGDVDPETQTKLQEADAWLLDDGSTRVSPAATETAAETSVVVTEETREIVRDLSKQLHEAITTLSKKSEGISVAGQRQELSRISEAAGIRPVPKKKEEKPKTSSKATLASVVAEKMLEDLVESVDVTAESNKTILRNFAKKHNITEETVNKILKSYETVYIEEYEADRGVRERRRSLEKVLATGSTSESTKAKVEKGFEEALSFAGATEESIDKLKDGIGEAENRVASLQARAPNGPFGSIKANQTIQTEYFTHEESGSKGKRFDITVRYNKETKKWEALTDEANKRIEAKESRMVELNNLLVKYRKDAGHLMGITESGGVVIPKATKPAAEKQREADRKHIVAATGAIEAVFGKAVEVNKIILGETKSDKWSYYGPANPGKVNPLSSVEEAYTADDVVLIHNKGTYSQAGHPADSKINDLRTSFNKKSKEKTELDAAMAAGATLVLDRDNSSLKIKGRSLGAVISTYITSKNREHQYTPLGVEGKEAVIFVPATEENLERYEKSKAAKETREKTIKDKARNINKLVNAHLDLLAINIAESEGRTPHKNKETVEQRIKELQEGLQAAFTTDSLKSDIAAAIKTKKEELETSEKVEEGVEETLESIADNPFSTYSLQELEQQLKELDTANLTETDQAALEAKAVERLHSRIQRGVDETLELIRQELLLGELGGVEGEFSEILVPFIKEEQKSVKERMEMIMEAWREASTMNLEGQEHLAAVNEILKDKKIYIAEKVDSSKDVSWTHITPSAVTNSVLESAAGNGRDVTLYSIAVREYGKEGNTKITYLSPKFSLTEEDFVGARVFVNGKEHEILSINTYTADPIKLLKVREATPLGTLTIDNLPPIINKIAATTMATLKNKKVIPPLSEKELDLKPTNPKEDPKAGDVFMAIDSPVRGLIFAKDGSINPNVAAALGIAIRNLLGTDKRKLSPGFKTDEEIARMFNVRETEVTNQMRDLSRIHGVTAKSVASTLGKDVLATLGLGKNTEYTKSENRGQYERLVADLGNLAIEIGIQEGILELTQESSNDLAKVYGDGEVRSDSGEVTYFVKIKGDLKRPAGKPAKYVLSKEAETAGEEFELIEKALPDAVNRRSGPIFARKNKKGEILGISEARKDRAKTQIRNDDAAAEVPKLAQEALDAMMETMFEVDMESLRAFIDIISTEKGRMDVYEQLGFVEISENNEAYASMLYRDKENQQAKNDDIVKSVQLLEELYEQISSGKVPNAMFFEFYYTLNQRYNLNSNTINPQTDKLHRFFIKPMSQTVTYTKDKDGNLSYTYTAEEDGKQVSKTKDMNFMVRMALSQAMGLGTDKASIDTIIQTGNAILGLNKKQRKAAKKALLKRKGKYAVKYKNAEGAVVEVELSSDHLSHTLQAFDFLEQYHSGDTVTSSLSLEFDALTSGFSNKMQQFNTILENHIHLARVGFYDVEQIGNSSATDEYKQQVNAGVPTHELLTSKDMPDSYQNLAIKAIKAVRSRLNSPKGVFDKTTQDRFNALKPLLPGASELAKTNDSDITIDKALRDLFKPPFMTFNYAASISRIVENLGNDMINSVFSKIAAADLKRRSLQEITNNLTEEAGLESPTPEIEEKAETLFNEQNEVLDAAEAIAEIVLDKNSRQGITIQELQERLRNEDISKLRRSQKLIAKDSEGKVVPTKKGQNIVEFLADTLIVPTYGESIKEVFQEEFKDYIAIQDLTNDLFKTSFYLFETALMEKVKGYREQGSYVVSEEFIEAAMLELVDVFPIIKGPLSKSLEDGIHIYDTDTRTPNTVMATNEAAKLHLGNKQTTKADGTAKDSDATKRKMNPIIRQITAAVNAGAVVPFHAIDGAQMATMYQMFQQDFMSKVQLGNASVDGLGDVNLNRGLGIIPIHDAIITMLPFAEEAAWTYNKATYGINSTYSMMDELVALYERLEQAVNGELADKGIRFNTDKLEAVRTTKYVQNKNKENKGKKKEPISFSEAFNQLGTDLRFYELIVRTNRAQLYNNNTGTEARLGAMVGSANSDYIVPTSNTAETTFNTDRTDSIDPSKYTIPDVFDADQEISDNTSTKPITKPSKKAAKKKAETKVKDFTELASLFEDTKNGSETAVDSESTVSSKVKEMKNKCKK